MNNKYLPLGIDLFFCLVLLPALIMLLPVERWLANNSTFVVLLVGWLYAVYFLTRKACVPMLFRSRRQLVIALCMLAGTVLVTWLVTQYQMEFPFRGDHPRPERIRRAANLSKIRLHQQGTWFLYLVTICFSIAVGLLTELYRQMTERQSVEFEKKKAELALYKAQINPHFLFNTLNTLYGLMLAQSEKAESAFMQFINLMRYMYTNNIKDKIPLQTEVEYIRQYIELQRHRMPDEFQIDFTYQHDTTNQLEIAPMILITFVENVFKHGVSAQTPGKAAIRIQAHNGILRFETNNPLLNHTQRNASKGIGIENCQKRLDLLYPNRYKLFTGEKEGNYIVTLQIDLNT